MLQPAAGVLPGMHLGGLAGLSSTAPGRINTSSLQAVLSVRKGMSRLLSQTMMLDSLTAADQTDRRMQGLHGLPMQACKSLTVKPTSSFEQTTNTGYRDQTVAVSGLVLKHFWDTIWQTTLHRRAYLPAFLPCF